MAMQRFFLILVAILASSGISAADSEVFRGHPRRTGFPDQCFECLECTVGDSAMIARATLQADQSANLIAVVSETIKGSAVVGSRIPLGSGYSDSFVPGDDVLLLGHGTSPQQLSRCYALDGQSVVMLMDLQKLTKPEDIVAAARSIAANPPSPRKTVGLWSNGRLMQVPANERLQQLGRQWAAEKSVYKRLLAIQALREFPSAENEKLIEPFLDDTRTEKPHHASKWQVGNYTVREKAAEVLFNWGYDASPLPMSGPLLGYKTIRLWQIAIVPLLGGLMILLSCVFRRSIRCGFLVLCALALVMLWWRSQSQVDELMFSVGSAHHEIASYGGGIQYQVMQDWDASREIVYGSFDRQLCDDVWSIDSQNPASHRSTIGFAHASGLGMGPGRSMHRFGLIRIPYWGFVSLAMIPLAFGLRGFARQVRRQRLGLCLHCGYDLRESRDGICPECGNQTPKTPASAALLRTNNDMPIGQHAVGV